MDVWIGGMLLAKSTFLSDREDLKQFHSKLAAKIGLNESIILQQIDYWIEKNRKADNNYRKGRYWTYNTYEGWQRNNFQFWSVRTIIRAVNNLEEKGLIISDNFNKAGFDRTKWYTIDYDRLQEVELEIYT